MKSQGPQATQTHTARAEIDWFNMKPQVPLATPAHEELVMPDWSVVKSQVPTMATQTRTSTLQTVIQENIQPHVPSSTQTASDCSEYATARCIYVKSQVPHQATQTHMRTQLHTVGSVAAETTDVGEDNSSDPIEDDVMQGNDAVAQLCISTEAVPTDGDADGAKDRTSKLQHRGGSAGISTSPLEGEFVRSQNVLCAEVQQGGRPMERRDASEDADSSCGAAVTSIEQLSPRQTWNSEPPDRRRA